MLGYCSIVFFSLMLATYISKSQRNNNKVLFLICISWWLLLSLQYGVGTDYFSYLNIFSNRKANSLYYRKKEYLFFYIVDFIQNNKLPPQTGFFIVYAFLFWGLYIFFKQLRINSYIYIYIYICCSTFLFNATNALRQYTAIPYICISVLYLLEKKYKKCFMSLVIPVFFHRSTLLCIPIVFFLGLLIKIIKKKRTYGLFLLISVVLSFVNYLNIIEPLIKRSSFANYLTSEYIKAQASTINVISKFIFFPIYVFVLYAKIPEKHQKYVYVGILSYCMKLATLKIPPLYRLSNSFDLLTLIPLFYYFKYNRLSKNLKIFLLLYFLIAGLVLLLVRFYLAEVYSLHEYAYKSILSI